MSYKRFAKEYLTFSRKDRIGAISLLGLLLFVYLLPTLFRKHSNIPLVQADSTLQKAMDTVQQTSSEAGHPNINEYAFEPSETTTVATTGTLFSFDPNTLPPEGWKRLGLNDKVVRTITNYRNKGGHFYKPEDVQKIWGLPAGFYERVKAYINIPAAENHNHTAPSYNPVKYAEERRVRLTITDINTADTTSLIALPGIGSKLAFRIINFRDKLGGFHSVDQIGETYGLPDSTFQKIKPYLHINADGVRKININTATKDDLKAHPYVRWNLANAIVEYRNQHGPYKSLEELKNIVLIDEAAFNKIAPYIALQ